MRRYFTTNFKIYCLSFSLKKAQNKEMDGVPMTTHTAVIVSKVNSLDQWALK